ncbi:Cytochrome c [Altererythrobacter epoxidivorans]|uniref:Cytochrome c n=1 Tax=Altererythrobacter epoxidivorans TaxID=361183 RepID=A0A0M4LX70_9SPHN|nr:c-type cytochrome [Altererythrobacter epoxidivorans]ALE18067.1 Cytochrome c [Altererythrobacter epoxidivorans]
MRFVKLPIASAMVLVLSACGGSADEPAGEAPYDDAAPEADETAAVDVAPEADADVASAGNAAPAAFTQCKTCHSVEMGKNMIGPSLAGVFGASAGHVGDFAYSTPMRESGLTWDEVTLGAYLENPQSVVPGTKMSFAGVKDAARRQEVIDYLKTLK